MTTNPIFDAIDDEIIRALEKPNNLPQEFTIYLEEAQFLALLAAKIVDGKTGIQITMPIDKLHFTFGDRSVWIKYEV